MDPKAKTRLTAIETDEVSAVDHAANLTTFVVRKNDATARGSMDPIKKDDAPPPAPEAPPPTPDGAPPDAPPALTMPQAAKDAILTCLAGCIDALSQLGEAVKGATVDDQAAVPSAVPETLGKIAEMIEGLEAQYGGAPEPEQQTHAPPPDGAPPDATKELELAKSMVVEDKGYANCMKGLPPRIAKRVGGGLGEVVAKVGRKMAAARLATMKSAIGIHDQATGMMKGLVKELESEPMDEDKAAPAPPPPAAPPAENKAAPAAPPPPTAPAQKSQGDGSVMDHPEITALTKRVNGLMEQLGTVVAAHKEQATFLAEVNKVLKQTGAPTAIPADGSVRTEKKKTSRWANDLSEVAKQQQQQETAPADR